MEATMFGRIRQTLLQQQQGLWSWLRTTPPSKKQIRLGSMPETAAHKHLQVLEEALEKTVDQTLGICEVCHDYVEPRRLEMDYTACVCLDHFSGEEKRMLEFELELSQKVQQALLPQAVPDIPGLDVAAFSQPAQIVGGDYFDFCRFRDEAHGLLIADVMGKGMSASMLMASLQSSLRILVPDSRSPAEVLRRINHLFCHNIHLTKFVTLFLAHFDPETFTLTYASAGHNPPLLLRQGTNGREPLSWLMPTGPAIGLVEEFQIQEETITLLPGDILLLYTDGVTEAMNLREEEFGTERLATFIQHEAHLPAKEMIRSLRAWLRDFTQEQPLADDTTIVVFKVEQ